MNGHLGDHDAEVRVPRRIDSAGTRVPLEPATQGLATKRKSKPVVGSYGVPNMRDWYFFAVELQTALHAGVPFVRAVGLVGESTRYRSVRRATDQLLLQLRSKSADKVLAVIPGIPPLIRNLLAVGLRGGDAPGMLAHIVSHYGWLLDIRTQILRVITYPAALIVLGTIVLILRDVVIASFKGLMSTEQALIFYSLEYGLPVLAGAAAGIIFAWIIYLPAIRPIYDRIILTAPIIGKMIHQYAQAVFFRVLAVLIEAGMPITDAWSLAAQSAPNAYFGVKLESGLRFLQDGEPLTEALRQAQIMDADSRSMAAIGEMAGSVPGTLRKYSAVRETELRSRVKMLTSVLGLPCLGVIALGFFVNPIWLAALAFVLMFIRRAL